MKINREEKRLNAIKETYPLIFPKKCVCCQNEYVREKMWKVDRWSINKTIHTQNYCRNCTPNKKDVLNSIDTDINLFGIAIIDNFFGYPEKDKTKYQEALNRIHNKEAKSKCLMVEG